MGTGVDLQSRHAAHEGLHIFGGFDDDFRREGLVAFANLAPLKPRLTMGPWLHCRNDGLDLRGEALRFFDHFLKGAPAPEWMQSGIPFIERDAEKLRFRDAK